MEYFTYLSAFLVSVYSLKNIKSWRNLNKEKKFFLIFLPLICCSSTLFSSVISQLEKKLEEEIKSEYGVLKAKTDLSNQFKLMIGDSGGLIILPSDGNLHITPSPEVFKLINRNGQLFINTDIRDEKGKLIASIRENKWEIFDNINYEYNNDDFTYEIVKKGERNVFFQIEFKNKVIHFQGYWLNKSGKGLFFYANKSNKGGFISSFSEEMGILKNPIILPYFKYPRSKFLGIRDTLYKNLN